MNRLFLATAMTAALAATLSLSACSNADTSADLDTDNATVAETVAPGENAALSGSVSVTDGYIMAPLKGRDVAAGYFMASNSGDTPTRLVLASSPVADTVELHTHSMEDGVMKMREVDAIEIPADGSVAFEPGGFHLMMFGFDRDENQTETPVTLTFDDGVEMTLTLPIRDRD